jgi:hypothetical protein
MNTRDVANWIQYAGITVAMAGGARWASPYIPIVAVGLGVLAVGIVWMRAIDRRDPHAGEHGAHGEGVQHRAGSIGAAGAAIREMNKSVHELIGKLESDPLPALAEWIERMQRDGTEVVASAQDAFVRAHGFAGYAAVMSPLASGERWLYRGWSAASDGHRPELISSVREAIPFIEEAVAAFEGLTTSAKAS